MTVRVASSLRPAASLVLALPVSIAGGCRHGAELVTPVPDPAAASDPRDHGFRVEPGTVPTRIPVVLVLVGRSDPVERLLPWADRVLTDLRSAQFREIDGMGSSRAVQIWLPPQRGRSQGSSESGEAAVGSSAARAASRH